MKEHQETSLSPTVLPVTSRCKTIAPKLRHHKATGQAYVVLNGQAIYFGAYGTDEATERYHQTIAEWVANGRQPQKAAEEITISELAARFWIHAEKYYRDAAGRPTTEIGNLRVALRHMCNIC